MKYCHASAITFHTHFAQKQITLRNNELSENKSLTAFMSFHFYTWCTEPVDSAVIYLISLEAVREMRLAQGDAVRATLQEWMEILLFLPEIGSRSALHSSAFYSVIFLQAWKVGSHLQLSLWRTAGLTWFQLNLSQSRNLGAYPTELIKGVTFFTLDFFYLKATGFLWECCIMQLLTEAFPTTTFFLKRLILLFLLPYKLKGFLVIKNWPHVTKADRCWAKLQASWEHASDSSLSSCWRILKDIKLRTVTFPVMSAIAQVESKQLKFHQFLPTGSKSMLFPHFLSQFLE